MNIRKIVVGPLDVNCYVISDASTPEALIIDPGDESERIIEVIDSAGLKPKYILFTHAHYDHVCAAKEVLDRYSPMIVMHEQERETYGMTAQLCMSWGYAAEDFPPAGLLVKDRDVISIGAVPFTVIHTPGHTPGSICLYGENTLFTGDTLFKGSAGRTDLPGGDYGLLSRSLRMLRRLPPETAVMCGHDDDTSLADEIKHNPFMQQE